MTCNKIKVLMKRIIFLTLLLLGFANVKGQSIYDTGLMQAYVKAYGEMSMRAAEIRSMVQPYREQQRKLYENGSYEEAIDICLEVFDKYIYYRFDNNAIWDMEIMAGDAAIKIQNYEQAVELYQLASVAKSADVPSKMLSLFYILVGKAREYCQQGDIPQIETVLTVATKTGYVSGEYYYYWGRYYEYYNDFKNAKKMYKLARRKKYVPAKSALAALKNKQKN